VAGADGAQGLPGEKGEKGDPGTGGGPIFANSVGLPNFTAEITTNCSSATQDAAAYNDEPVTLPSGYFRPVFVGDTTLGHVNGGVSEISVSLQTITGMPVTDFTKTVSSGGTNERSFRYVYLDQPSSLLVHTRVSTNCGIASVSGGVVAFERVSD